MQAPQPTEFASGPDARSRIIAAAVELVARGGRDAATTRAVAAAADVQAPTIYRLFGDKHGLLQAVAEHVFAEYVAGKASHDPNRDPVEELLDAWDTHIAFGIDHPAVFGLMIAPIDDRPSSAKISGLVVLRDRVRRVALTGRLLVTEERAVDLIHAIGTGTIFALLEKASDERDAFAKAAREAVFAFLVADRPQFAAEGSCGAATALRAALDTLPMLTKGERLLLDELLERIVAAG